MPPQVIKTKEIPINDRNLNNRFLRLVGYKLCVDDLNELYSEFTWMYDLAGGEPKGIINGGAPQDLWLDTFDFVECRIDQDFKMENNWMAVFVSTVRVPKDLGANRDEHEFEPVTRILWARKK